MMASLSATFLMYVFIAIGFSAKKIFTSRIDATTLNLLSVYFLQPFLTLWGLMLAPLDIDSIMAPLAYMIVIIIGLFISVIVSRTLFDAPHDKSIATVAALIGNTGNLGIPLGIALFGLSCVPVMTLINLANIIVVYTVGVYIYSRGNFSIRQSLINILKLPVLWFAIVAVVLNVVDVAFGDDVARILQMGAYAAMVVQLLLFGIYLYEAKLKALRRSLMVWVLSMKFVLLPVLGMGVLMAFDIDPTIKAMVLLELFMPLAVANINIASLYKVNVPTITALTFISSILFLGLMVLVVPLLESLY